MKKILLLVLSAFCLGACSVDTVETDTADAQLLVLDATYTVDGCNITTFDFDGAGKIEVRNDRDFIYVKILATGDYDLVQSNLHIAADISGFPTTRNGGIILNNMDQKTPFNPAVKEYTYKFPIDSFGDSFIVGAYSIFQLENKKYNIWTGDLTGNKWSYFEYILNEHPYNTGSDKSREISVSEAAAAESWDEVRKLFSNMLDPGVPRGWRDGTYEPSIWELINMFHSGESMVGEYTTTYTLGSGECKDSVILTVIVVPDEI